MARITVIGGTGYAGAAVVAEAVGRGHKVTAVSRSAPAEPLAGVKYVQGSIVDADFVEKVVKRADAVVSSVAARGDMVDSFDVAVQNVVSAAAAAGARLVVVGGYSTLRREAGGPRIIEGDVPAEYVIEASAGYRLLQALEASPASLNYVYLSPAAKFGAWVPGDATGNYKLGGDVALVGEDGSSFISAPDLALAVLDLVESEEPVRDHFSVVSP